MENSKMLVNNSIADPINCKAIILGDRRQKITNPVTGEKIENTSGEYLWKIDAPRKCSYFLVAFEDSRMEVAD